MTFVYEIHIPTIITSRRDYGVFNNVDQAKEHVDYLKKEKMGTNLSIEQFPHPGLWNYQWKVYGDIECASTEIVEVTTDIDKANVLREKYENSKILVKNESKCIIS